MCPSFRGEMNGIGCLSFGLAEISDSEKAETVKRKKEIEETPGLSPSDDIQINIYDHTNPPKELSEEASTVEVQFLVDFWAFCPSLYIAKLISKKGVMKKLLIDYCSAEARTACA